jgi:hypothetical protein
MRSPQGRRIGLMEVPRKRAVRDSKATSDLGMYRRLAVVKSRPIRDWTSRRFRVFWVFSKNPKLVKVISQVETVIICPLPGIIDSSGTSVMMH